MNDIVSLFPVDSCFQFNFVYMKQIPLTLDMAGSFTSGLYLFFFPQKQFNTRRDLEMIQFKKQVGSYNFDLLIPQPAATSFNTYYVPTVCQALCSFQYITLLILKFSQKARFKSSRRLLASLIAVGKGF